MNLNQVNIIGRVGQDPDVKSLPSGGLVCTFSIATTRKWVGKDGQKQEQTEWHNIVFFGDNVIEKLIAPYVMRGSEVYVGGRLQTRSWEKDGQKHYRTEIVGEKIELGQRPKDASERPPRSYEEQEQRAPSSADEDFDTAFGTQEPPEGSPTANRRAAKKTPAKGRNTGISYPTEDINPEDIPF